MGYNREQGGGLLNVSRAAQKRKASFNRLEVSFNQATFNRRSQEKFQPRVFPLKLRHGYVTRIFIAPGLEGYLSPISRWYNSPKQIKILHYPKVIIKL